MLPTLLRRLRESLLLLVLLVSAGYQARATHLLGGEMSYRYLDANGPTATPFRYEITANIYYNGLYTVANPSGIAAPPAQIQFDLYNKTTTNRILSISAPRVGPLGNPVYPPTPQGCAVQGPSQPFYLSKYVQIVNLPVSFDGYYAVFTLAARNTTLTNINNPGGNGGGNVPMTLYVSMAPPLIVNRSPVFSDTAVAIVCQNDTTISLNNAVDPDGDRLVYSFGTPYGSVTNTATFPPLPQPVPYNAGYSGAAPFGQGPGNFALINANTGIAKYGAKTNGLYGIAVDVAEYRTINGREVLIGTTRRDLQLVVSTCPPTPPPVLPPALTTPRNYTIEEGETLSIPITATQATGGHPLLMTVNSALLDGSGPFNATFNGSQGTVQPGNLTGTATATGTGTVSGTFVFNSVCGNGRVTPYDLSVTVRDNGCGGKLTSDVFRITVNRAAAPTGFSGPTTVCDRTTVLSYTATGPASASYRWRVTGGTIASGQGTSSINVTFPGTATTGSVSLKGVSVRGCLTDSVFKNIEIRPLAITVSATAPAICLGASTTLSVAGQAGLTYSWTGGGQTSTATSITVAPTATTTYTVTATDGTCSTTATFTVTVYPSAVADAGPARITCPDVPVAIGATPIAGTTYAWSPVTGLSSPTVANPTVTLPNTTNAPITTTYTLTATTTNGCVGTGTVVVTVNPAPVVNAGPDVAVCDRKQVTLGTPAVPGYTYSWSPATGLSSSTVAQPVFTGANLTANVLTLTYTLTATSGNGCPNSDAVVITVNPRPMAESIAGPTSVCPTVTGVTYSVPNPAATDYRWLVVGGTLASGQGTPSITVDWGTASPSGAVKVYRFNAQGCSSDTTVLPVIINQRLQTVRPTGPGDIVAVAPLPRAVCQADGPYTYASGTFATGSSFSWTIIGGTQVSSTRNTVTVAWNPVLVPTIGKIVATETSNPSGGICRGTSDTLRVLVNPSPRSNLAIVAPARVCAGSGAATFSLPGGFASSSYVFKLDGNILPGTGSTRTLATLPAPGTYTLTVQETTAAPGSCVGPLYTTPFVVAPLPVAPVISGSGFVCNTATPQQYAIANPSPGATYQWTVVGGRVTTGGTGPQVTITFNPTGPYSVSAVEVSAAPNLCAGPAATRVILPDNPTLALTNVSVDATSNSRVIVSLSAPNSANTPNPVRILRRVAGSGAAFAPVGTVAASATSYTDNNALDANANSYEYQLDLTNGCGTLLPTTVAQTIRLTATPTAGPGGRDQGSVALAWNGYVGFAVKGYEIYRRLDNGSSVLLASVPAATRTYTTTNTDPGRTATGLGFAENFRVVALSTDATALRSNSNETAANFANAISTYNIITPNRDGKNDVLVIDNIQLYPGNTLAIFNRWGREVYKTTNYQNNWGQDDNLAAGNYFYLLKLPDGSTRKNWFEVVK
ncbi:gliding motility-associated C-terminal domain-containing protein [Hymenobacter sp. UYCo722]|uniref:T9SS type B sorting domain-containing protein n=1 Tax=Hymenobacter sp. UYCo722 TaxID=3156335 RepID=UPI003393DA4C